MPSPSASISTTALSVSISSSISPFLTCSPSFFSQDTSLPVSCAISSAGITTLTAITGDLASQWRSDLLGLRHLGARRGGDHLDDLRVGRRFGLTNERQCPADGDERRARDQQLLRREPRDDFVAGGRD